MWQRRDRPSPHSDGTDDDVRGVRSLSLSLWHAAFHRICVCVYTGDKKKIFLLESEIIQPTHSCSSSNESITNVNVILKTKLLIPFVIHKFTTKTVLVTLYYT